MADARNASGASSFGFSSTSSQTPHSPPRGDAETWDDAHEAIRDLRRSMIPGGRPHTGATHSQTVDDLRLVTDTVTFRHPKCQPCTFRPGLLSIFATFAILKRQ